MVQGQPCLQCESPGQPCLQCEVQDSQDYTVKFCLGGEKTNKQKTKQIANAIHRTHFLLCWAMSVSTLELKTVTQLWGGIIQPMKQPQTGRVSLKIPLYLIFIFTLQNKPVKHS